MIYEGSYNYLYWLNLFLCLFVLVLIKMYLQATFQSLYPPWRHFKRFSLSSSQCIFLWPGHIDIPNPNFSISSDTIKSIDIIPLTPHCSLVCQICCFYIYPCKNASYQWCKWDCNIFLYWCLKMQKSCAEITGRTVTGFNVWYND